MRTERKSIAVKRRVSFCSMAVAATIHRGLADFGERSNPHSPNQRRTCVDYIKRKIGHGVKKRKPRENSPNLCSYKNCRMVPRPDGTINPYYSCKSASRLLFPTSLAGVAFVAWQRSCVDRNRRRMPLSMILGSSLICSFFPSTLLFATSGD